jgi:hypothetical protein
MTDPNVIAANPNSLQETLQASALPLAEGVVEYANLGITASCALFLLLIHWAIPRIRKSNIFDHSILNSIAGGMALGYVFLQALPSLIFNIGALKEQAYTHFLNNEKNLLFVIFMFILAGFFVFYTLEKIAHDKSKKGEEGGPFIYYSHIGILTYLNFSVALIIPLMINENFFNLLFFTSIVGFQFILEDHAMTLHFPTRFNHIGRYIVMGGVCVGWPIGAFLVPHHTTLTLTLMNAFFAGAIVLSTIKTEFALLEGRSHFPTFIASLSITTAIVFILLLLENIG